MSKRKLTSDDPFRPRGNGYNWLLGYSVQPNSEDKKQKKVAMNYHFMGVKSHVFPTLFQSTER